MVQIGWNRVAPKELTNKWTFANRAVEVRDKALTHGMGLTLMSFFALIPGPILFGRIIDSTCKIWTEKCGERGNCLLYDQDQFRYWVNLVSACFTSCGVFFDVLVWHFSKSLDLYGQWGSRKHRKKSSKNSIPSASERAKFPICIGKNNFYFTNKSEIFESN